MNIKFLRETIPAYSWSGERVGFGWSYVGRRDGKEVRLVACSVLSGFTDDDFSTRWMIQKDDGTSEAFSSWAFSPW